MQSPFFLFTAFGFQENDVILQISLAGHNHGLRPWSLKVKPFRLAW